jgi:hypothetical protein
MNKRKYLAIVIISSFLMTGFLFIWAGEVSYIRIVDVTFGWNEDLEKFHLTINFVE